MSYWNDVEPWPSFDNPYMRHVPSAAHPEWDGLNECVTINSPDHPESDGYCLPNCVGYCWGRWYRVLQERPTLSKAAANKWYGYTADGYDRSYDPVVGAVICWEKQDKSGGHVGIVEEILENGDLITSNSWWSASVSGQREYIEETITLNDDPDAPDNKKYIRNVRRTDKFQGFIIPPDAPTPPPPPPPPPPGTQSIPIWMMKKIAEGGLI